MGLVGKVGLIRFVICAYGGRGGLVQNLECCFVFV